MANGFSTSMVPQSAMVTSFKGLSRLSVLVFSTFLTTSWGKQRRESGAMLGTGRASSVQSPPQKAPPSPFSTLLSPQPACLGSLPGPALPLVIKHTFTAHHFLTMPSSTLPKTTCLPSSHGVFTVVMKNWEPLVSLPALAMLTQPGP